VGFDTKEPRSSSICNRSEKEKRTWAWMRPQGEGKQWPGSEEEGGRGEYREMTACVGMKGVMVGVGDRVVELWSLGWRRRIWLGEGLGKEKLPPLVKVCEKLLREDLAKGGDAGLESFSFGRRIWKELQG
jgi:hypothetical protein